MRYDKYLSNNTEKVEDTKRGNLEVVIRKRTDNTMAKRKRDTSANNGLQSTTQKTKDRVTRTSLKPGVNSGRVRGSCSTCGTHRVALVTNQVNIICVRNILFDLKS